jgi:ubiquinone/menaquinone biosynthesis C-methylase UbiE
MYGKMGQGGPAFRPANCPEDKVSQTEPNSDPRKTVIASELAWHEQEAHRRVTLDTLLYDPPAFDPVVNTTIEFLLAKPGERVLDMGGGEGKETLELARRGLVVISVDLSHVQLSRARQLVEAARPGTRIAFIQANAEELPFAADSFRIIHGKAIIHHLDLARAAGEIGRVLTGDGRAIFAEPMNDHPLFRLGRQLTPQLRTRDEHPLTFRELRQFGTHFGEAAIEEYFLLAPLSYPLRLLPGGERLFRRTHRFLQRADRRLFDSFARLREIAWYGVIKVKKDGQSDSNQKQT